MDSATLILEGPVTLNTAESPKGDSKVMVVVVANAVLNGVTRYGTFDSVMFPMLRWLCFLGVDKNV